MTGPVELSFTIRKPLWLTSNRHHTDRAARARIVRDLHAAAGWYVRGQAARPVEHPVEAVWTIHYPKGTGWQHGDASNAQPTTKALLDGLVEAGLLPGDGPRHVVSETHRRGPNLDQRDGLHVVELALHPAELPPWLT